MQELHYERFHQLHPRVMLKMEVVYLKGLGLNNALISRITGVCGNTLREYRKEYAEGGIEQLKKVKFYQPQSDLKEDLDTLLALNFQLYDNAIYERALYSLFSAKKLVGR